MRLLEIAPLMPDPPLSPARRDGNSSSAPRRSAETDAGTIARLATLDPFEYDRMREAEADILGVRVSTLDKRVAKARGEDASEDAADESVLFPDLEPWPEPVDGAALLTDLAATFGRHIAMPAGAADVCALWTLHAHAHDAAYISPILAITSPTPECGKTTLFELLGAVVRRPLLTSNITAAALFRAVDKWRPTLLVDEADTYLPDNDQMRGVLDSGHNRAAAFVIRTVGDDHEPRRFNTWAPKAIALIGKFHPTLASRAIHIQLQRLAPGERVEPVRADRLAHLEPLRRRAARWAQDHLEALKDADPMMPTTLAGRRADNWRPLLAIADIAEGEWPDRARRAAEALNAKRAEETTAVLLLEDVREIFTEQRTDRIASAKLAQALGNMEQRPWPEWSRDKPITAVQIAKLLRPFGINPQNVRDDSKVVKGYRLQAFADTFARYLPCSAATPLQTKEPAPFRQFGAATEGGDVAASSSQRPVENVVCSGVAATEPPHPREGAGGASRRPPPC